MIRKSLKPEKVEEVDDTSQNLSNIIWQVEEGKDIVSRVIVEQRS